jgi:hypothetical protein
MQSSDPRGVSVAKERPECSGEPADLAKSGIHSCLAMLELAVWRHLRIEPGAYMS